MTEVEEPFDFDGDEWDEWFAHGSPSERLECAGPYDAARTAGSMIWSQFLFDLPHGWVVADAIESPLDIEWHDPRIRWMRAIEVAEEDPHRSYLTRVAILAWETYTTARWPTLTRKGAAYSLLRVAVESHGYVPRGPLHSGSAEERVTRAQAVSFFLDPPEDFFERLEQDGGHTALADLLTAAFQRAG